MKKITGRILVPGGVLSPGELRKIVSTAHYYHTHSVAFGNRQDILMAVNENFLDETKRRLSGGQYHFTTGHSLNNIVTSFAARNVFHSTPWLTEGVYLEILSTFTKELSLKVNITDPYQSLVTLFSGQLNFVASHHDNYWYLFLNLDSSSKPYLWPVLIDGNEIGAFSETIEELVKAGSINMSPVRIETSVYNSRTWNFRIMDKPLSISSFRFQNYEGFHSMGEKFWLGIYQRDGRFPVNFLENLCILCLQTNIGSVNITPWNSLLIKNIEEKDVLLWENLLGQFGINTGHSHLELNWYLPESDSNSLKLKNYIFKRFEKTGLRTEGLTFGIGKENDSQNPDTSIIIKTKTLGGLPGFIPLFKNYSVSYRKNFDPNSNEIIPFADGLKRRNLPDILAYLCSMYYKSLSGSVAVNPPIVQSIEKEELVQEVFQCKNCLTVYDPLVGDEFQNILPGTPFEHLPQNYQCPLCEENKESFNKVKLEKIGI